MTLQIYDKMTVGQTMQQNTQAWDNQKEGLGPKPLRHKLNSGSITSDGTSVEKHRDLTRLHLLSETAKWWPDTKYLLSKLKAKKKIKMLFSCTVC